MSLPSLLDRLKTQFIHESIRWDPSIQKKIIGMSYDQIEDKVWSLPRNKRKPCVTLTWDTLSNLMQSRQYTIKPQFTYLQTLYFESIRNEILTFWENVTTNELYHLEDVWYAYTDLTKPIS